MKIRSSKDLKNHLRVTHQSPEEFALRVGLSHMTIRRWVKKSGTFMIPGKYHLALDHLTNTSDKPKERLAEHPNLVSQLLAGLPNPESQTNATSTAGFTELLNSLEKSGEKYPDVTGLRTEVKGRMKDPRIDGGMRAKLKSLLQTLFKSEVPLSSKAVIVGALLYFLNPMDLIPDSIPVVGYVDDLAVLTLAADFVVRKQSGIKKPR